MVGAPACSNMVEGALRLLAAGAVIHGKTHITIIPGQLLK